MADDDGLIREVDEAMQQERWQDVWRAISKYVYVASGVILFATIAYVLWERSTNAAYEEHTAMLYRATSLVEQGKSYEAREVFEALAGSESDLAPLADMWLVKLKIRADKAEEARTIAQNLYNDASLYHQWMALYLPTTDEADDSAFRHSINERNAVTHMKRQAYQDAARIYDTLLQDSDTPPSMRDRAGFLLDTYLAAYTPSTQN